MRNRKLQLRMKGALRPIAGNMIKARLKRDLNLDPMLISFLVTTRCNFKCKYCDNGNGNSYNECAGRELTTDEIFRVLKIIREKCSWINISGGEPLIRKDIVEIMKEIRRLKFSLVMLNTNGALLDKKQEVLNYIDYLVISLDSMNDRKFAEITGTSENISARVKENILFGKRLADRSGIDCVINSVIMDDTISDCREC
jgi:GTP 3',8-cyclase